MRRSYIRNEEVILNSNNLGNPINPENPGQLTMV